MYTFLAFWGRTLYHRDMSVNFKKSPFGGGAEERMTSTKFETKPLFTRQQLTALLLPLIAEQALSVTIGLADP